MTAPIIKTGNDIPVEFTIYENGVVKDMTNCTILAWGISSGACAKLGVMYVEFITGTNPYSLVVRNTIGAPYGNYWVKVDFEDNGERRSVDGFTFTLAEHSNPLAIIPTSPIPLSVTTGIVQITTLLGVVRYDESQTLTPTEEAQARTNIGASSQDDFQSLATDVLNLGVTVGDHTTELSRLNTSISNAWTNIVSLDRDVEDLTNNKADKTYVDQSIRQAIDDSWGGQY